MHMATIRIFTVLFSRNEKTRGQYDNYFKWISTKTIDCCWTRVYACDGNLDSDFINFACCLFLHFRPQFFMCWITFHFKELQSATTGEKFNLAPKRTNSLFFCQNIFFVSDKRYPCMTMTTHNGQFINA